MISSEPAQTFVTRASRQARSTRYSVMKPYPPWTCTQFEDPVLDLSRPLLRLRSIRCTELTCGMRFNAPVYVGLSDLGLSYKLGQQGLVVLVNTVRLELCPRC
jgi:hypothetical protein